MCIRLVSLPTRLRRIGGKDRRIRQWATFIWHGQAVFYRSVWLVIRHVMLICMRACLGCLIVHLTRPTWTTLPSYPTPLASHVAPNLPTYRYFLASITVLRSRCHPLRTSSIRQRGTWGPRSGATPPINPDVRAVVRLSLLLNKIGCCAPQVRGG